MIIRFWGTRGSLPTALTAETVRTKILQSLELANGQDISTPESREAFVDSLPFPIAGTFGGASSCVEIDRGEGPFIVCDMGSGLREFGLDSLKRASGGNRPGEYVFFISHVHWDHICGFPFFVPAFNPANRIRVYGGHDVEAALVRQQDVPSFPVPLSFMGSEKLFTRTALDRPIEVDDYRVTVRKQHHHGDSFGYRFEIDGKVIVYTTDAEHKLDDEAQLDAHVEFMRDADLVIFDTMYSMADAISIKEDWGHSSNIVAVDLCHRADVRHLVMFHHEPVYDDAMIRRNHEDTIRYEELLRPGSIALKVSCAYDGLEIEV